MSLFNYFSICETYCTLSFTLQVSHKARNRDFGWNLKQHMNMIRAYLCLYNRHLFPCAQLPQYFPDFPAFLTEEHLAPIFRREYDVIFAVPFCMR